MILSILMPTYNRSKYLNKNLEILNNHINQINGFGKIEIVVSNNCSTDDTDEIVENFIKTHPLIKIKYVKQKTNIGLEKNALAVLEIAEGEHVMYLGDDDFIEFEYFKGVLDELSKFPSIHLVIPSIITIDINDNVIKKGRDHGLPSRKLPPGFKNCLINSWRGHQLSGLVLKRDGLFESYIQNRVGNIYLFIYFAGYTCLRGETFHFTDFPVRVTEPGQTKKDWVYGEDGLINEVFDNYIKLPLNQFQITRLQLEIINRQPWRLWKVGKQNFYGTFLNMWTSKNSTFLFKILFPFVVFKISIKKKLFKMFKT